MDRLPLMGPTLRSERGHVDPTLAEDDEEVDLIETSQLYKQYGATAERVQTISFYLVYFFLIIGLFLTLWLKMERGEFPFNVDPVARFCYWPNCPGTPGLALAIVFGAALVLVFIRLFVLQQTENQLVATVKEHLLAKGTLRDLRAT